MKVAIEGREVSKEEWDMEAKLNEFKEDLLELEDDI